MSGHADSIRRAREVRKEGVVKEILNAVKNAVKAAIPELIALAIDVATIVAVPTLIALFWTTTFEGFLAAGGATLITILVSDSKQKLLQRLKQPKCSSEGVRGRNA
jgi:hypothetical protein